MPIFFVVLEVRERLAPVELDLQAHLDNIYRCRRPARVFHFEHGLCPWWERDITKPFNGKTYTPDQWLNWAIRRYAWAWPKWEKPERED